METPSITVPLYLEQDRPFIDLTLTGPAAQTRTVRCWVDTGASNLTISEQLARDLGLTWTPLPENPAMLRVEIPRAQIGDHCLDLTDARIFVQLGGPLRPGVNAEAIMSSQILARRHVIFDYPNGTFTIAAPGALVPRGIPVHTPSMQGICFPRLEVEIDGQRHGLLFDTGATCTMISAALLAALTDRHPDWPHTTGAAGIANMIGAGDEQLPLVRIPQMTAGDLRLEDVLVVGRGRGTFEQYMSQWMTAPIIGALAGNALKQYRVEIDYANQITYFERLADPDPGDCNLAGVILHAHPDGSFTLAGTSRACGYPEGAVQPGDRLLAVDGDPVSGLYRPQVLALLRGALGEVRRLTIERRGDVVEVALPVVRVL